MNVQSKRTRCDQLRFEGWEQWDELLGKTRAVLGGLREGAAAGPERPSLAQHAGFTLMPKGQGGW